MTAIVKMLLILCVGLVLLVQSVVASSANMMSNANADLLTVIDEKQSCLHLSKDSQSQNGQCHLGCCLFFTLITSMAIRLSVIFAVEPASDILRSVKIDLILRPPLLDLQTI